jgi:hypothetical protein
MFGIDTGKVKQAFAEFNATVAATPEKADRDPLLMAVVAFLQALGKAFA